MTVAALPARAGPTITRARPTDVGLDQQRLYGIGLEHVQRLARDVWTDYNVHDPGVTALELLCFALTDLTARALLPVEDLLASGPSGTADEHQPFPTARSILTNRPLTAADYRKLLIDAVGVKNAWISPARVTYYADPVAGTLLRDQPGLPGIRSVTLKGLYEARVEFMDGLESEAEREAVLRDVRATLAANRNLCEEFVFVAPVERQPFLLCGELELDPDADVAQVVADVFHRVQAYLAPPVHTYTLSEMLEHSRPDGTRYTIPDILDGPRLRHGFVDDVELDRAVLRSVIRLSDVISVVMDIDGVRAVRDMIVSPPPADLTGPLATRWLIPVEPGKQPRLDRQGSRLVCYKGSMPVMAAADAVAARHARLVEEERRRLETVLEEDVAVPLGRDRDTGSYYSVQHHFPAVYGLQDRWGGLGADDLTAAVRRRGALAYQLKGYLLFFDQLMADYCAQLNHVRELFSTDPDERRTYFAQLVTSVPDVDKIYPADAGIVLDEMIEDDAAAIERRHRFLDHLIARFAERFHDYANIMRSVFEAGPASTIPAKCLFLREYPALGAERSLAYNRELTAPGDLWNSPNVSGFERRVARLLDMPDPVRRNLSELPYDLYPEVDQTAGDEFRFRVRNRTTSEIVLSSSTRYATAEAARAEMLRALERGRVPEAYERKVTRDGRHYFNIVDETGEVLARRIEYFDSAELRDQAIEELTSLLRSYTGQGPRAGEGMYVIENILLRPAGPDDPFLPICFDPSCTDCADDDPYSYRLHIVLPTHAGRFANMDFRRFAEEVIREETPAHILPKVCWIAKDDMVRVEKAYREWLTLPSGASAGERRTRLAALRDALYGAKNVYPPEPLRACDAADAAPKFILGQSAISSQKAGESPP